MSVDYAKIAKDYWDAQPHPKGHGLTIGEFATAVKLATLLKFGGHASGAEAALFMPTFKASGMSPEEFEHAVENIAPLSYTYHGRPPSMKELVTLKDKAPHEVSKYFGDLPDRHYPHVSAAAMVKSLTAATPHAQEHLGRPPVKLEAAYLAHSNEHPRDYYARLAAQKGGDQGKVVDSTNVVQAPFGGQAGGRGLRDARGQASGQ